MNNDKVEYLFASLCDESEIEFRAFIKNNDIGHKWTGGPYTNHCVVSASELDIIALRLTLKPPYILWKIVE